MYYSIHTSSTISFICPYAFSDAYHSIIYHSPWAESIVNERINKQISEFIFWKIERTQTQTKCIHMHTHLRLKHHHTSTSHLQHINLHFTFILILCVYRVCMFILWFICLYCFEIFISLSSRNDAVVVCVPVGENYQISMYIIYFRSKSWSLNRAKNYQGTYICWLSIIGNERIHLHLLSNGHHIQWKFCGKLFCLFLWPVHFKIFMNKFYKLKSY